MSRPATSRLKVNAPLGNPPTLEWQPVTQLAIDPTYQRSVMVGASQSLIRRIASFWDWGLCQPLAVARRPDGSLMIVDGQHRFEAAKLRRDIPHLPCVITSYANDGDEAAAFVALNQQRRPLSRLDLFKAALAAEDDESCAIHMAIERAGLCLAAHSNFMAWEPGDLANIGGIQTAWRGAGAELTEAALKALALAFEGQILRYAGTIFPGIVGALTVVPVARCGENFDRLVDALKAKSQVEWRRLINVRTGETGERRSVAAKSVVLTAFMNPRTSGVPKPPAAPTDMAPAEMAWCEQCDMRKSGAQAARCTDPYCKLKVEQAA